MKTPFDSSECPEMKRESYAVRCMGIVGESLFGFFLGSLYRDHLFFTAGD